MIHSSLARRLLSSLVALSGLTPALGYPAAEQEVFTLPGSRGAVASESSICSQIGIDLIARGGNAADAMVGTTLCVGVISMYHSGIGGGGFMLIRDSNGNYETVDYREAAPAAAYEDMYEGNVNGSVFGGLSAGVPGDLRGLQYLHEKYGALPWRVVVNPAVHVARDGFNVTADLVRFMNFTMGTGATFLVDDPSWARDFAPNGTLLKLGDLITRERYADTLEKIGLYGADVFYEGEIAESMIKLIQETNGTMTLADLKNYKVVIQKPLSVDFRGYKAFSTSAPSSGAVLLHILKIMEQYDLADREDINLTTHRFDEAMRFAYGARLELGDPPYVDDVEVLESRMLSEEAARAAAARIRDDSTLPVDEYISERVYSSSGHGTSHIVTADGSGMTVTSTTTINLIFGAQIMTPDTGIILNDEMNDFSIPGVSNEFGFRPSPANYVRGGKRPLSSITPVIIEFGTNRTLLLAAGSAGGSRIISTTAQAVWHVLEHGMNMTQALAQPRVHDQLMPNTALLETGFDPATAAALADRGHNLSWSPPNFSAAQGIRRLWDGSFEAAAEPRQKNSGGFSL